MKKRPAPFKFEPFSKRQLQVLTWWTEGSPYKDYDGIVCDGSVRSGKTISMSLSYILWAMTEFDQEIFGMAGKTIGSFRRNVLKPLFRMLEARGIRYEYKITENLISISWNGRSNEFYVFGGKDESSQDLVQGVTLAGFFFDEAALMPESFFDQATTRCSVEGAKIWINCNPAGPIHWLKQDWIDKAQEKHLLHLHFIMDDNLSLSERVKETYKRRYTGVFYDRYILGLWSVAEGIIYDMWDPDRHIVPAEKVKDLFTGTSYISCDYGTQNPTTWALWTKLKDGRWYCQREYYYSGREKEKQKTDEDYVKDFIEWIGSDKYNAFILDPSAASFKAALERKGVKVIKAKNQVLDGIREQGALLQEGKLIYSPDCKRTAAEYAVYAWDPKARDRGEDKPLKVNDHAMDRDRYMVNTIISDKGKVIVKDKRRTGFR